MEVIRCDRCGKIYEYKGKIRKVKTWSVLALNNVSVDKAGFDLCEECHTGFKNWITHPETNEEV